METQATMRIYVGGVGETVREEDIRNTFSKLGAVEAVEFVRTKGRSIAYIDFLPSSDKSAAKLFSTYNGCAWKGGKLRLEKAKEHYLERMKREWAEDAELANKTQDDDDAKNEVSLGGHMEIPDESTQIHMYFPRLRKVKAFPYKGSGKHKYSFQRLQVPSLAAHFCDCVEHSGNISTTKGIQICHASSSMKDGGMNEDEINMMNSVLNKFLERENRSAASGINSLGDAALSDHLPDDQNNKDDSTEDDDNIIINAVAGPDDMTHLLESMKKQTGLHTKMARSNKLRNSANMYSQNDAVIQKGKGKNTRKKGKLVQVEESDEELEFSMPNRKRAKINQSEGQPKSLSMKVESGSKKSTGNTLQQRGQVIDKDDNLILSPPLVHGGVSDTEAHPGIAAADSEAASVNNVVKLGKAVLESRPPEQLNEATNTDPKQVTSEKPDKGASSRKSAWMQLVGSANNSPFSISQILPETEKPEKSNPSALKRKRENTDEDVDSGKSEWVVASTSECFDLRGFGNENQKSDILRSAAPKSNSVFKPTPSNENNRASTSGNKSNSQEKRTFSPIMRTTSSMKDWMKTKAALSRSLKKNK